MDGRQGLPPPSDRIVQAEVTGAAAGSTVNMAEAAATGEAGNAGMRDQSPP